ncbi:MAG TPA: complex I NDUFA9 subunit family protein [Candidatus Limnocylindrales bacterium]|nr:complex I NDUFA9 subunit family protein [Candidatus Limnocylindrales bacterium]
MERRSTPLRVAVIGATGFVGRHVVARLAESGHQVVAISRQGRHRTEWSRTVEARAADVTTGAGLGEALAAVDAAVHLVAIPRESKGRTFDQVNVGGTRRTVEAAAEAGVRRFVHLSALGVVADPNLDYLYSKWRGEQIVRESPLDWVVLRPSLLFGAGDGFFSLVRTTLKWWSPGVVAVPGDGSARFQPLAVDDLAHAVERAVVDDDRAGSVYEIGGPDWVTYREIVDEVMRVTGMRRLKLGMPIPLISALTTVTDRVLPIFPVSHDQIASLQRPNYTERDAFEKAFGFSPRPMDLEYLG